jgi:hypothetical protein
MSRFRISIIDTETGQQALLVPGGSGERDLIQAATDDIVSRGVGYFKSEAAVRTAVEQGLRAAILAVKKEVRPR